MATSMSKNGCFRSHCAQWFLLRYGVVLLGLSPLAVAQESVTADGEGNGEIVTIHCPNEIDLQTMVDYCGKILDLRFVYGEELLNKKVQLRPSPIEIPRRHLLSLLASLLRVRDLAMVEESPGFYRIVAAAQSARSATAVLPSDRNLDATSLRMVTQVLTVPSGKLEGLTEHLQRFTSSPKGGLIPVPEKGLLIVTDYESRISMLRELLTVLDAGGGGVEVATMAIHRGDPATLAEQVSAILDETYRLDDTRGSPPVVLGNVLANAIVVIGRAPQVAEVRSLVESLAPADTHARTRAFRLRHIEVDRAELLIKHVLPATARGASRDATRNVAPPQSIFKDKAGGRLFVTAGVKTLDAIGELLDQEDRPIPRAQRPLRIYHPKDRSAAELVGTLTQLLGDGLTGTLPSASDSSSSSSSSSSTGDDPGKTQSRNAFRTQVPPVPPREVAGAGQTGPALPIRIQGANYVLTVDEHTNAILAIGTREFHAQLESLIDDLDRRRPQVLIEVTLVALTMSDSLDLGVELQNLDLGDAWDFLLFSNFGLSSLDVTTGQRVLQPGVGANGILFGPDEVPIVLRALATNGIAKVLTTARLLVADNARGTLRSVDEAPFTAVNASDTVATTSFGGFESAGTTLSVTPHILEGDHLTLDYELTFSNFTGSSSTAAVPPPRTTNSFTSRVEVPDGYTVVTGGLVVDNLSDAVSEVPLLGRIPHLGRLFQSSSVQKTKTKVFAFVRPVILREDKFADLKFISLKDVERAELIDAGTPEGKALWMR